MRVLVGCEISGRVRDALCRLGHDAWSVDLDGPAQEPELFERQQFPDRHIQGDVFEVIDRGGWDMILAFPDCTYLSSSRLHWNGRVPGRAAKTEMAVTFARMLIDTPAAPRVAVENPIGCLSTRIRKPDQIIQPYHFGEDASKATCLWLKGLPELAGTEYVPPRIVNGKKRWANQTDSGQNRLGPSPKRARERGLTYPGISDAMALQWGGAP